MYLRKHLTSTSPTGVFTLGLTLFGLASCSTSPGAETGQTRQKIVGGDETAPGEYPWMAQVSLRQTDGTFKHGCGGSLIAPDWVLTAAHCVHGRQTLNLVPAADVRLTLGEHDLHQPNPTGVPAEQVREVAEIVPHPAYALFSLNDVALLRLSSPASLNDRVQLVHLALDGDDVGETTWLSGWGYTSPPPIGGTIQAASPVLKDLRTTILDPAAPNACNDVFAFDPSLRPLEASEICTLGDPFIFEDDGYQFPIDSSACFDDSGSPVVVHRTAECAEQVGVHTWGDTFCAYVNVSARVSSHVDWIRQHVPNVARANVYEAEDMFHSTGGPHPGGWNIWTNGYIAFSHTVSAGAQKMVVRAAGESGDGWPEMQVTVNGAVVYAATVSSADWNDHTFSFDAPVGNAEVRVYFTNDYHLPPADRNLLIDNVRIVSNTCGPASPPPDSVRAAFVPGDDWGGGYCMTIAATNDASVPTSDWYANFNVCDATIYTSWNGTFSSTTGAVMVSPTIVSSQVINPGATDATVGFCANRGPSGFKPENIDIWGTGNY